MENDATILSFGERQRSQRRERARTLRRSIDNHPTAHLRLVADATPMAAAEPTTGTPNDVA
jgi:hypothetical protein